MECLLFGSDCVLNIDAEEVGVKRFGDMAFRIWVLKGSRRAIGVTAAMLPQNKSIEQRLRIILTVEPNEGKWGAWGDQDQGDRNGTR